MSCTPHGVDAGHIDLNRVATFVQIARAGGVTAAAAKLKIPKSSVSRALTQLEAELGAELVVRSSRRFRLTDAGRTFFEAAAKGIETVTDAREEIRREKGAPRGLVRIAAPPDAAMLVVAPAVARFIRQYPEVHVELSVTGQRVDPTRDGFDLVVSTRKLVDSSAKVRTMTTIDGGIFASPTYLRERGRPTRPSDLTRHDCILREGPGKKDRWELIGPRGPIVVAVDGHLRVDDLLAATAAATAHAGLVVLPLHMGKMEAAAGALERVLSDHVVRGDAIHVVYPASRHVPTQVAMLCDAILAFARNSCPGEERGRANGSANGGNGSMHGARVAT